MTAKNTGSDHRARTAAALRANLQRRKAQARARAAAESPEPDRQPDDEAALRDEQDVD